jgi:hypothetical protein
MEYFDTREVLRKPVRWEHLRTTNGEYHGGEVKAISRTVEKCDSRHTQPKACG